jgi:flagellin FlaB
MKRILKAVHQMRGERGITGLETAIILIAFVVVAAVFAFVVLSTGLFSSERGKETVYAGLAKTRGTMQLTGGVVAENDDGGTTLSDLTFNVVLAAGGDTVNLDDTDLTNFTVISYVDTSVYVDDVNYTTTEIIGDGDLLLEQGEMAEIVIDLEADCATCLVAANEKFTLEVKPPSGSYMVIERTAPASIAESVIGLN